MHFTRYIKLAFESLISHKLRALLTMLGIIIGVTSVTTTISMGEGLRNALVESLENQGAQILFVGWGFNGERSLTLGDAKALADPVLHPQFKEVVPAYFANTIVVFGSQSIEAEVVGTTTNYEPVRNLEIASGRFLAPDDIENQQRVVVASATAAKQLFDNIEPLGQSIRIRSEPYRIIGVLADTSGGLIGPTDRAQFFVPLPLAQRSIFNASRIGGDYILSQITVQVADSSQLLEAEYAIERTMRIRHDLSPDEENDFSILNQVRIMRLISTITQTVSVFLGSIGAVSLLVGGIGIMNIMLVSVAERTREIGLRKALGARNNDILFQFLTEAVLLTLFGGTIGTALTYGVSLLISFFPDFPFQVVIGFSTLLIALGVSLLCGVIFGIYPALRATKLNPIDALRSE